MPTDHPFGKLGLACMDGGTGLPEVEPQVCWAVLGGLIVGPVSLFVIIATAVAPR
jgi:hypothetical protein